MNCDTSWSYNDLANVLSKVFCRPIEYRNLSRKEYRETLSKMGNEAAAKTDQETRKFLTMPETNFFVEAMTTRDELILNGEFARTSNLLPTLLGRPTIPLRESIRRLVVKLQLD